MDVQITVSPGELVDRMTILQLKIARGDPEKSRHFQKLYALLSATFAEVKLEMRFNSTFHTLQRQLYKANETLWNAEDTIRQLHEQRDYGAGYISTSVMIHTTNDRRAAIKIAIDRLLGSAIADLKTHQLPEVNDE